MRAFSIGQGNYLQNYIMKRIPKEQPQCENKSRTEFRFPPGLGKMMWMAEVHSPKVFFSKSQLLGHWYIIKLPSS